MKKLLVALLGVALNSFAVQHQVTFANRTGVVLENLGLYNLSDNDDKYILNSSLLVHEVDTVKFTTVGPSKSEFHIQGSLPSGKEITIMNTDGYAWQLDISGMVPVKLFCDLTYENKMVVGKCNEKKINAIGENLDQQFSMIKVD